MVLRVGVVLLGVRVVLLRVRVVLLGVVASVLLRLVGVGVSVSGSLRSFELRAHIAANDAAKLGLAFQGVK